MLPCTSCALGSESRTGGPLLNAPYLSSVLNLTLGMSSPPPSLSPCSLRPFTFLLPPVHIFAAAMHTEHTVQMVVEGLIRRRLLTTRRWRYPRGCLERARPLLW